MIEYLDYINFEPEGGIYTAKVNSSGKWCVEDNPKQLVEIHPHEGDRDTVITLNVPSYKFGTKHVCKFKTEKNYCTLELNCSKTPIATYNDTQSNGKGDLVIPAEGASDYTSYDYKYKFVVSRVNTITEIPSWIRLYDQVRDSWRELRVNEEVGLDYLCTIFVACEPNDGPARMGIIKFSNRFGNYGEVRILQESGADLVDVEYPFPDGTVDVNIKVRTDSETAASGKKLFVAPGAASTGVTTTESNVFSLASVENFTNCDGNGTELIDASNVDSVSDVKGWTFKNCRIGDGCVRVGNESSYGFLTTPVLQNVKKICVSFYAKTDNKPFETINVFVDYVGDPCLKYKISGSSDRTNYYQSLAPSVQSVEITNEWKLYTVGISRYMSEPISKNEVFSRIKISSGVDPGSDFYIKGISTSAASYGGSNAIAFVDCYVDSKVRELYIPVNNLSSDLVHGRLTNRSTTISGGNGNESNEENFGVYVADNVRRAEYLCKLSENVSDTEKILTCYLGNNNNIKKIRVHQMPAGVNVPEDL